MDCELIDLCDSDVIPSAFQSHLVCKIIALSDRIKYATYHKTYADFTHNNVYAKR